MFQCLLALSSLALALVVAPLVQATRHYSIVNNCPLSINLYINGEPQGSLSSKAKTARDFPDGWSGFIYNDFNRGNVDGAGTVRAGFFGDLRIYFFTSPIFCVKSQLKIICPQNGYYYVVQDPNWLNVGMRILPIDRPPAGGFCLEAKCEVFDCPNSFTQPPTRFPPPTAGLPPQVPLYECPVAETGYIVEFCPSGTIPNYQTRPNQIQPIKSQAKCLDVRGAVLANGTPVQIYDCNGTGAQKWVIKRGGQQIMLSGTDLTNGRQARTWQCTSNNQNQLSLRTPRSRPIVMDFTNAERYFWTFHGPD